MKIIRKHLASYNYSLNGIWLSFRNEPNMLFHLIAAITVILINIALKVDKTAWLITLLLLGSRGWPSSSIQPLKG